MSDLIVPLIEDENRAAGFFEHHADWNMMLKSGAQ
jgi:hypothetical protein